MQNLDTVIPNSLNYTDIKPQAVENTILLCRYQPTATVSGSKGNDMIKFLISGNGFLDPYSTYFQFTVQVNDLVDGEIRFVDRSAHSFIQRMVIRSQGVELERIENYDVVAAMINDMIYSPEQCMQHFWEGFPTHVYQPSTSAHLSFGTFTRQAADFKRKSEKESISIDLRDEVIKWLNQGSSPSEYQFVGETAFHKLANITNTLSSEGTTTHPINTSHCPVDYPYLLDYTFFSEKATEQASAFPVAVATELPDIQKNLLSVLRIGSIDCALYPTSFAYHSGGVRVPTTVPQDFASGVLYPARTNKMQFIIPIYSGVLGLLLPEKKLLPLNLLPLDIEIVFNPHAMYSSFSAGASGSRSYSITEFFIYGNTLFFEQEIHRTLEASVADHGLFLYCNSFHSAPQQMIATAQIPSNLFISMNLKSINSVHWVFMYTHYETQPCARKLHFVSHNVRKMQLLNGTQLIPQYPVEGNMGQSGDGSELQFLIELYKAWNKMHDPARDGALHAYNMCGDQYAGQFDPIFSYGALQADDAGAQTGIPWSMRQKPTEGISLGELYGTTQTAIQIANKQGNVGRCQYGISLEGEELGADRTMITGRKSQYPFQLQLWSSGKFSNKTSYMFAFLRADFIIFIRPDLQIVTLGK